MVFGFYASFAKADHKTGKDSIHHDIRVSLSGLKVNLDGKDDFSKADSLLLIQTNTGDAIRNKYIIVDYTIAIALQTSGQSMLENWFGNRLSNSAKRKLKTLIPKDLIVIANVRVKGPDGIIINVEGATYIVK